MDKRTYYTAVGRFTKRHDADGNTYPVIYVNQQEHLLDLQEMAVWTALTWRLSDFRQLERKYDLLARELHLLEPRTWKTACTIWRCAAGIPAAARMTWRPCMICSADCMWCRFQRACFFASPPSQN